MSMRSTPLLVFVCLFAFSTVGQTSSSSTTPPDFASMVSTAVSQDNAPGAVLLVDPPGAAASYYSAGYANLATNTAFANNMTFRIGSNTKTFTATVILQLIDEQTKIPGTEQIFTLDTIATAVLGTAALQAVPNANLITVQQLLNMTSGIYDYNDTDFQNTNYSQPGKKWTPQEIVDSIKGKLANTGKPYYFMPGAACGTCSGYCATPSDETAPCFMYSNTNFIILGMMIEKLTGDTAEHQITTRIIDTLKLTNTSFPTSPSMTNPANGYVPASNILKCGGTTVDNGTYSDVTTCFDPSPAWTAGAMVSNLADLQTWLGALVSGKLISAESQAARTTWIAGQVENIPIQYGLGLMRVSVNPAGTGAPYFQGHAGEFYGYGSVMMQGESPCPAQVLDFANAMPTSTGYPTYADIFFAAGATICGNQSQLAATRAAAQVFSKVEGPLFWTD